MATATAAERKGEKADTEHPFFPSTRFTLIFLLGLGAGFMFITRFNVNIAVICMVDDNAVSPRPSQDLVTSLGNSDENRTGGDATWREQELQTTAVQGEFHWAKSFQGLLLSSYFYGYTAALVPAGLLADRLPVVALILAGVGSQGICTLAVPAVARVNAYLLLALRALQGLCCSVVLPAATVFVRNWSAPAEYTTAFALCWSIQYLSVGAAYPISSALCQAGGWPLVFYVTGALPLLWVVAARFVLTTSPDENKICSEEERQFLASKRICRIDGTKSPSEEKVSRKPTPLVAIVTNRQVWIIVGTFFSHSWFYYSLNVTLPTFLKETMGVNLAENGILSGLPAMSMTLGVLAGGKIFQYLLTRWKFSRTTVRKIMATISMVLPAALLGVILILPPGRPYLTTALLVCSNTISVLCVSGGPLSAGPDIAPQFAGVIWGLSGSIGNLTGVLAPTVAAAMTPNKTLQEWRTFFLIAVVISVAMDIIILLFWKSEIQPFAKTEPSDQRTDNATVEA